MSDPVARIPLAGYARRDDDEILAAAHAFEAAMRTRRTVREFSDRPVPRAVIESCLRTAGRAPSGANQQPWHFVAVADPDVKRRIRDAAETEERAFYEERASQDWLDALAPLGTDADKPFLDVAPWLIAVFEQPYALETDGRRRKHYYPRESVGLAAGFLLAALHRAGLATLTHTPSPMGFLNRILGRPAHERAFVLLVVGHPAEDATVPAIDKKPFDAIATFVDEVRR